MAARCSRICSSAHVLTFSAEVGEHCKPNLISLNNVHGSGDVILIVFGSLRWDVSIVKIEIEKLKT